MILQVNKILNDKDQYLTVDTNKTLKLNIHEDYIEVNSVKQLTEGIIATVIKDEDIYLSYSKEFIKQNGSYNYDNQGFYIKSVYLLDDTGKTIKRIM